MAKRKATKRTPVAKTEQSDQLVIAAPNMQVSKFRIFGTAPYVQNKFSTGKAQQMLKTQQATKATSRKSKAPRDIEADFRGAMHKMENGKDYGIPAPAFRSAMISACRVAGFTMTKAKLSIFVLADGLDDDGTPLVLLDAGEPEMHQAHVRLESGVASIAIRPMWRKWQANVTVKWDGDQFSQRDVANLLERAGQQVGVGEGRPDSKKSHGMGWGTFTLLEPENI